MKVAMKLLSDVIFGSGISVPGGEDVAVLQDESGFPYYKGNTFKGVFREEYENYLMLVGTGKQEAQNRIRLLFGKPGECQEREGKLRFSDFTLSPFVKRQVLAQGLDRQQVLEACTYVRVMTAIGEEGQARDDSLRSCRCIKKGMSFYGEILFDRADPELAGELTEVLRMVKWLGTSRTRGLGKVKLIPEGEVI